MSGLTIRRIIACALLVGLPFASAGCSTLRQIQSGMSSANAPRDIGQWTVDSMGKALTAINAKIGADPADYEELLINEIFVRVQAIDPLKRVNVDEYTYQGEHVEVAPVDVSANEPGAIEMAAFKGNAITPAVLDQVMKSAPADSGVENAAVEFVLVHKVWANADQAKILVAAKGPRGSKNLYYDLAGHLQQGP